VKFKLTSEQSLALEKLESSENVFLTGSAGTGKSFLVNHYLKGLTNPIPVLASTGAAAVLVNGRTFHSYFGLGIMRGGLHMTVEKAAGNPRVKHRLKSDSAILVDEVSMIHPDAFLAAHEIAKKVRGNDLPFGGLRLIVVGDFLQLPPVDPYQQKTVWLFQTDLWHLLNFQLVELKTSMRSSHEEFVRLLNEIRMGRLTDEVSQFLDQRIVDYDLDFEGTVLVPRRAQAEAHNLAQLSRLPDEATEIKTEVLVKKGVRKSREELLALAPVPERLILKPGALVMIRKNDLDLMYVNGTLAKVLHISPDEIELELLDGTEICLEKESFHILGGDGELQATVRNFPLTLAWATTIHKSQGASIDRVFVDVSELWECGQAYVALSRARSPEGLFIRAWDPGSIKADPKVVRYYSRDL